MVPALAALDVASVPAEGRFEGQFSWPMDGQVTSIHWECRSSCARYHRGVDIANGCGTPIHAARAGVVATVGDDPAGYGNYVVVNHDFGFLTLYAHMASVSVSNGQSVTPATRLGIEGTTGSSTGCHVHFELRQDDEGPSVETKQFLPATLSQTIQRGEPIPFKERLVRVTRTTTLLNGPDIHNVAGEGDEPVGTMNAGQLLVAHSSWTNPSGIPWNAVSFDGRIAWIRASDVTATGGVGLRVTADGSLNVRSGPGTGNGIVGRVHGGQAYSPLANAADGNGANWYRIPFDGNDGSSSGWIHGGYTTSISFTGGDLAGKVIAVDAGHGGSDPGAQGGGVNEKDVTLAIALQLRDLLRADGATVLMTRETDTTTSLSQRTTFANNNGAHRFVSIHANSCGTCGADGTETYYHSSLSSASTSADLARRVQAYVLAEAGTRDRGVKQADFHVLRETTMPAVLVEAAFIDHAGDRARLTNVATQRAIALGILNGIQEHYGLTPHDPSPDLVGYSVDFESGAPVGWAFVDRSGPAKWAITTVRAASGVNALALRAYGAGESDAATTPPILVPASGATLTLRSWMQGERECLVPILINLLCTTYDGGTIELSSDGGTTWNALLSDYASSGGAFETLTFDLAGSAGDTILVRFTFESDASVHNEGWYIDDLVIK